MYKEIANKQVLLNQYINLNDYLSQVTFIYTAPFTIQIVSKQLHSDNMKIMQVCL